MRRFAVVLAMVLSAAVASAQTLDNAGQIRAALLAKYHLTQATADHTDIVTAGDVITLLKSGLVMYGTNMADSLTGNVAYRDGKLVAGGWTALLVAGRNADSPVRVFVSGEKFWLEDILIKNDGLFLRFMSDPINDVRYMGSIKFPFDKKQPIPPADQVIPLVEQVISAAPLPGANNTAAAAPAPAEAAPAPAAAAPPPIAPPPPPPDQPAAPPPTISLGQTRDQVVALFGQPTRVIKLGAKEIDVYKDMKVTFVNNKVTDVQ